MPEEFFISQKTGILVDVMAEFNQVQFVVRTKRNTFFQ